MLENEFPFFPGIDPAYATPMRVIVKSRAERIWMRHQHPLSAYSRSVLPWRLRYGKLQNPNTYMSIRDLCQSVAICERRLCLADCGLLPVSHHADFACELGPGKTPWPLDHVRWWIFSGAALLWSDVYPDALASACQFLQRQGWHHQVLNAEFSIWWPGTTIPLVACRDVLILEQIVRRLGVCSIRELS